jgi:hypothetical protein
MSQQKLISIAIIALAVAGGTTLIIRGRSPSSAPAGSTTPVTTSPILASIPTPAWYEAHPDVLRSDNDRCAAEGKNLPPTLCANVAIANKEVSSQDAIDALDQAGASGKN